MSKIFFNLSVFAFVLMAFLTWAPIVRAMARARDDMDRAWDRSDRALDRSDRVRRDAAWDRSDRALDRSDRVRRDAGRAWDRSDRVRRDAWDGPDGDDYPICMANCPRNDTPDSEWCGTDGETYPNKSHYLCFQTCHQGIEIDHEGPC